MTTLAAGVGREWLLLREPADAAARDPGLVQEVRGHLSPSATLVVHDLGCGTGSMGRWLAPRLPGRQHWVLHDREPDLLAYADAHRPVASADGRGVGVETRLHDVGGLDGSQLAGASLVTASALLDLLTATELERLVSACADAGCPALLTLSVAGRVVLEPPDQLDATVAAAFDAHQRRTVAGRRLLGPDAADIAAGLFRRLGYEVLVRPSPWRLGAGSARLALAWLDGWVAAAGEQRPELLPDLERYRSRRRHQAAAGLLGVRVAHHDLWARPR